MDALVFERKEARYAAAMIASRVSTAAGASRAPLSLKQIDPPDLPGTDWKYIWPQLSGICGSDLSTLSGHTSRYFEPLVSFPFVPGHEIVGRTEGGDRVVLDAVLGHAARGCPPPTENAAPADGIDHGHMLGGSIGAGLQIGSCAGTGGGWSEQMIAHNSQIHTIPDGLSDKAAVMIEPAASGIHAALKAAAFLANAGESSDGGIVVVLGAGTIGLCTIAALAQHCSASELVTTAKYPEQRGLAEGLGATSIVAPGEIRRAVRRLTGSRLIGNVLSGGADVVIDAVGSASSLADALAITRPHGRVILCGMPGQVKIDLAPLWHREIELAGCYTYGTEEITGGHRAHSFDLATDLVQSADLGRLVSATYRLFDYKDAIRHAAEAGRRGSIKIAFDLRG